MTQRERKPGDELEAINKKRSQILLRSALGLVILIVAAILLGSPEQAVVVLAVIVLPPFIGAAIKYRALGKAKAELLGRSGSAHHPYPSGMGTGPSA